jgi:hypothetical protein
MVMTFQLVFFGRWSVVGGRWLAVVAACDLLVRSPRPAQPGFTVNCWLRLSGNSASAFDGEEAMPHLYSFRTATGAGYRAHFGDDNRPVTFSVTFSTTFHGIFRDIPVAFSTTFHGIFRDIPVAFSQHSASIPVAFPFTFPQRFVTFFYHIVQNSPYWFPEQFNQRLGVAVCSVRRFRCGSGPRVTRKNANRFESERRTGPTTNCSEMASRFEL